MTDPVGVGTVVPVPVPVLVPGLGVVQLSATLRVGQDGGEGGQRVAMGLVVARGEGHDEAYRIVRLVAECDG